MKDPLDSLPPIPAHYETVKPVPLNYELRGIPSTTQLTRWHEHLARADFFDKRDDLTGRLLARGLRQRVAEEKYSLDHPDTPCDVRSDDSWSIGWLLLQLEHHLPDRTDLRAQVVGIFDALTATGECL